MANHAFGLMRIFLTSFKLQQHFLTGILLVFTLVIVSISNLGHLCAFGSIFRKKNLKKYSFFRSSIFANWLKRGAWLGKIF
jgi:hypothetical protein